MFAASRQRIPARKGACRTRLLRHAPKVAWVVEHGYVHVEWQRLVPIPIPRHYKPDPAMVRSDTSDGELRVPEETGVVHLPSFGRVTGSALARGDHYARIPRYAIPLKIESSAPSATDPPTPMSSHRRL